MTGHEKIDLISHEQWFEIMYALFKRAFIIIHTTVALVSYSTCY